MSWLRRDRLVELLALTVVYFAAGRFGLLLAVLNENTSAVWPPTGIAVAAMLLFGRSSWPAILVGAFLVNVTTSGVALSSLLIGVGNTLEAVVAAALAHRYAGGPRVYERAADIVRFTLVAIVPSAAIAATIGTVALLMFGLANSADAMSIWVTWWLGDTVGAIAVAPILLLWRRPSAVAWTASRVVEAVGLAAFLVVTAAAVFRGFPLGAVQYPLEFLLFPGLLWAAFRFGSRETAIAAAGVSVMAIDATLRGLGPFARGSTHESLLLLQTFVGVVTTVMLAVAAEVGRRRAVEKEIRSLNDALERRVSERTEELRILHDRLAEAQQIGHVGSWEWSVTHNTLWWSEEMYRIYGIAGTVPTYEAFLERLHPDDRGMVESAVGRAMSDGQPFAFDHRIVRPDGTVRTLRGQGRVIRDVNGNPVRMVGVGHDITEQRKAEDARAELAREQAARREAEESSRVKDRFLAMLSHELRTPLNAALGWARMLLDLPQTDARVPRATQAIYRNLVMEARLVSDMIDVSKAVAGLLDLERAPVEARVIVDAAVETVRESSPGRDVTFEIEAPVHPVVVVGDPRRLQQVVWNLLENAVKFSEPGTLVQIAITPTNGAVEIAVADDGPGIPVSFLPYVFEEFRQGDESLTREHRGLGLGLAIARHIVEQHGGTIVAANRPSGGAIFTVRLPAEAVDVAARLGGEYDAGQDA